MFLKTFFRLARVYILLFFLCLSLRAQNGFSIPKYSQEKLKEIQKAVDEIYNDPFMDTLRCGFYAKSMKTGQILAAYNEDSLLSTASCMKLVTTAAALERWGNSHTFRTGFYTDGPIVNGVVEKNLYLKGFGDPYFLPEILLRAAYHMKALGITEVKGKLIADDSYLIDTENAETNDRAYSAIGGALGFNFNIVNICVRPGEKVGDTAIVFAEPISKLIKIINGTKTTDSGTGIGVNHNTTFARYTPQGITISLYGAIGIDEPEFNIFKKIENPTMWTATVVKETLDMLNIPIRGGIEKGTTPEDAKLIIDPPSYDLSYIIAGVNKWSNNYVAGQLLMVMGAEEFGTPGTDEKGIRAIRKFLDKVGVSNKEITMVDGSGLDVRNQMTPKAQVKLMEYMFNDFRYMPEYVASFSIGGIDGTEKKRFKKNPYKNLVQNTRAKVGFLYGVNGLSGYIQATSNHDVIAFSILTNNHAKDYYETVKRFEDRLAKILSDL